MTARKGKLPVVFLHGLGGSRADWQDVADLLSKSCAPLLLDLPGSGSAPKPEEGYDPLSLARWTEGEMERAGLTRACLVGHSLGARVAAELAAAEPVRARRLVLVSPVGAVSYSLADRLKWMAMSRRVALTSVPVSSIRNASAYGFAIDGRGKRGFVERAVAARTGPEGEAVARAVEKSVDGILQAPPLVERLKGTRVPLLILAGAQDPLAPPNESGALKRARHDATFVTLPGVGHYPMLEDPRRVADALRDFLGS